MATHTYYTAVGHFKRKHEQPDKTYPVVMVNRREHMMDIQKMALWACLNWRLLDMRQLQQHYGRMARDLLPAPQRSFEACLDRLLVRGLVVSGSGETGFDALYDLLSGLYVVPISESVILRTATFVKMTVLDGVPISSAKQLFKRDRPNEREAQVMRLSRQALLSTAELIKCAEAGVSDLSTEDRLLSALYGDVETTSDNIGSMMQGAKSQEPITVAVANLYLRKQIIFERV